MKLVIIIISLFISTAYADLTPVQALQTAIADGTLYKIPMDARYDAFNIIPASMTVEYLTPEKDAIPANYTTAQRLARMKAIYAQRGSELSSRINSSMSVVTKQFESLPMLTVVFRSRTAMLFTMKDTAVRFVIPDRVVSLELTQSVPLVKTQDPLAAGATGGVTVAVLDTGLLSSSNLAQSGRIRGTYDGANKSTTIWPQDYTSHGTYMAAIIANVAPASRFVIVKATGNTTDTQTQMVYSALMNGAEWIINNGDYYDISVVNMSLSMPTLADYDDCADDPLARLIQDMVNLNMVVVAASGNQGKKDRLNVPGCSPAAISVAGVFDATFLSVTQTITSMPYTCVDRDTLPGATPLCSSNVSVSLDVFAPGCQVSVSGYTGAGCGTSAAAAMASGAIAVARSSYTINTPPDARAIMSMVRYQSTRLIREPATDIIRPLIDATYLSQRVAIYVPPITTTDPLPPSPTSFTKYPPGYYDSAQLCCDTGGYR